MILEKLSRTVWALPKDGENHQTRWFYERSRGQYRNEKARFGITPSRRKQFEKQNPRKQMFTKEQLAKYVNSYREVYKGNKLLIGPHFVVRGSQKNYSQFLNYNFKDKPDNAFFEDAVALAIIFKTAEKVYGVKPNALGDMRYIAVPYAIAWIGYKLKYSIDLYKIWKKQRISDELSGKLHDSMLKIENFIQQNAPGSLYGEWAKKENCWNQVKENDFNIELSNLSADLINSSSKSRSNSLTESEIDQRLVEDELNIIKSISVNKWGEISKLTSNIGGVTQHLKDRAVNIMSALKLGKTLSEKQRLDALTLIDVVLKKSPDFFDEIHIKNEKNDLEDITNESVVIDTGVLEKMVEWDIKAKVLSPKEVNYIAGFAYGLKKLNDFHKQNMKRYLRKLNEAGFVP